MKKQFKVAIVGPESTGKSSLSMALAKHYHTEFVQEIAREYLNKLTISYQENDLLQIAKKQIALEDELSKLGGEILICDTTLLVIKIWSEVKYQRCNQWILQEEEHRKYDLFLLCNIDLKWEEDPLREHPDKREYLYDLYREALLAKGSPFSIISGIGITRVQNALIAISEYQKYKEK